MLVTGDGIGQTKQVIKKESGKGGGCGIAAPCRTHRQQGLLMKHDLGHGSIGVCGYAAVQKTGNV